MRRRIQFPLRALLWLMAAFALLSLLASWLLTLPGGEIWSIAVAAGSGMLIGLGVCFVTQHVITGNVTTNVALVTLVAFVGVWFWRHLGSYTLGAIVGAVAMSHGVALINATAQALGITLSAERNNSS